MAVAVNVQLVPRQTTDADHGLACQPLQQNPPSRFMQAPIGLGLLTDRAEPRHGPTMRRDDIAAPGAHAAQQPREAAVRLGC